MKKTSRTMRLICILIVLLVSVNEVQSLGGVFELRIRSFTNPSGRDEEGKCCSTNGDVGSGSLSVTNNTNGSCGSKGQCWTKFRVCVKHYQLTIDPSGPCYFGETVTEPLVNQNNLTQEEGRIFHFPFNFRWPGTFSLIIEAWHHQKNVSSVPQRLITRMAIQQYLDVGEDWKDREWTGKGDVSLSYDYRVRCLPDYYGEACDKTCRPRDDKFGHYTCSDQGDIVCLSGWTGSYCEKSICLPGCHDVHGTCTNPNECICHQGWEGKYCSECVPYPGCKHGRCSNPYECECEEGWGGLFCNQDLNYCTNHKPCKSGGTCYNTGQGSYTCSCPTGFVGSDCQFRADGCTCVNGGTCRENGTAKFCQCPEGWTGPNCETLSLSCSDNPCVNGGTCTETTQVTCLCPPGFGGVFCDTPISEVQTNDCGCHNGGSCTSSGSCLCPSGVSGTKCETRVDNCASIRCENGGSCFSLQSGYRCQCPLGWTGDKCGISVNICATLPCANGGSCSSLPANMYKCDCASGFGGQDCSETCDCENGGACTSFGGVPQCSCPPNFTGPKCQFSNATTYNILPISEVYTKTDSNENLSAQHVIFVIIVSVATPLMVVVAVAVVLLLKRRKRVEQRRNDELARIQNEQNTVQCLTKKCNDPLMIVNTLDIPKAKCSNLDLSFNKGDPKQQMQQQTNHNHHHHQQHQYPSIKGGGSSSCLLEKGELLYQGGCSGGVGGGHHQHHHNHPANGGNRVSGLLINTAMSESNGSSCYSSPNHYSPSTKSLNMNNASPQQSPVIYHPGYHTHHHPHPPIRDEKDNLATEV